MYSFKSVLKVYIYIFKFINNFHFCISQISRSSFLVFYSSISHIPLQLFFILKFIYNNNCQIIFLMLKHFIEAILNLTDLMNDPHLPYPSLYFTLVFSISYHRVCFIKILILHPN